MRSKRKRESAIGHRLLELAQQAAQLRDAGRIDDDVPAFLLQEDGPAVIHGSADGNFRDAVFVGRLEQNVGVVEQFGDHGFTPAWLSIRASGRTKNAAGPSSVSWMQTKRQPSPAGARGVQAPSHAQ